MGSEEVWVHLLVEGGPGKLAMGVAIGARVTIWGHPSCFERCAGIVFLQVLAPFRRSSRR